MKIYLAKTFSEEEGPDAIEGKSGILLCSKDDVKALASFLNDVEQYLEEHSSCHMHFRDHRKDWSKESHIDIEINVGE